MMVMQLKWLIWCGLLLMLLADSALSQDDEGDVEEAKKASVSDFYNCRRKGSGCLGADSVCGDEGICECGEDLAGIGCQLNTTLTPCDLVCKNGGVCQEDACVCEEAWFGPECDKSRVVHTCSHDKMEVEVTPIITEGVFEGTIGVKDGSCMAVIKEEGTYSAELLYDGSCGEPVVTENDDGSQLLEFTLLVQYHPSGIVTKADQKIKLKCRQPAPNENVDFNEAFANKDDSLKEHEVETPLNPVTLEVTDDAFAPLPADEPVTIGDVICLVYTLNGGIVYEDFMLWTANFVDTKNGKNLIMVENGCITEDAGPNGLGVAKSLEKDGDTINLCFEVFSWGNNPEIEIENSMKVCQSNDTSCEMQNCTFSTGVGRRKRDATYTLESDEDGTVEHMTRTIYVYDPRDAHSKYSPYGAVAATQPSMWSCVNNTNFLILVIFLVVILLVSLGVFTACCVRAMHHNSVTGVDGKGFNNKGYA